MNQQTLDRIKKDFPESEQSAVIEFLSGYSGPEEDRVRWDILVLSKGSLEVLHFVTAAQHDYRDILYWAEYYDTDPMLAGRDPKKMVEDLIEKFGKANKSQ